MSADPKHAERIFAAALELSGPDCTAFLNRECGGDSDLRREVESLLAAHERAGTFIEQPAVDSQTVLLPTEILPAGERGGDRIGRYKLLEKIGEGGFGTVWMAEQEEPVRRRVALKIIKLGMDTREVVARFEAERQALALMDHPNIARVFDGGATDTGRPYFVMELVRGVPITKFCDAQRLSVDERLELFMRVCQAVQHAHQKGIIHRDIKPSNVLVSLQDDRPVPKVIDFGIAKATAQRLTEKTLFTRFHQFIGTPAYMSPEQTGANREDIDTRSDIYSLGVLLYELLTGRTPFEEKKLLEAGFEAILKTIREVEPPRPSTRLSTLSQEDLRVVAHQRRAEPQKLNRLVRGELDWIVMKALEKDRHRRYESASALARDLQHYLDNQPVTAAAPAAMYRFRKFVRRHRVALATATSMVALLVAGVVASTWQWRRAVVAQRGEAQQRRVAETNAVERREQLVRLDVANGVRAMENEDWFGALLWFTEALRQDQPGAPSEEMHRFRIGALLNYSPRLTQVWSHEAAINHVCFSPDGHWALTASWDGTARLWEPLTGQPGPILRHATNVSTAAFSSDGRRVVTVSDDATVRVWDAVNGQMACPILEHGGRVSHALISPDGLRVFTASSPAETNLTETSLRPPGQGELRIYDATTGSQVRQPFRRKEMLADLALSPDGQWLAAGWGHSVIVWNLRQPAAIHLSSCLDALPTYLPGLKPGGAAAEIEALLPEMPPPRKPRPGEVVQSVARVAFSPDSRRLVTAYGDGSAKVWSLPEGAQMVLQRPRTRGPSARSSWVNSVAFSPDGQRVLLVDADGIVHLSDARTGEPEGQLKKRADTGRAWFSPDGRLAFLSGQVWDIEADEAFSPRMIGELSLFSAAFSPDGAKLLTGGGSSIARLWSLAGTVPSQPPLQHDWATVRADREIPGTAAPKCDPVASRASVERTFSSEPCRLQS
jgi:WD40 repeat protein